MFKKLLKILLGFTLPFVLFGGVFATILLMQKDIPQDYRLRVEKGQGLAAVAAQLANDNVVYSKLAMQLAGKINGLDKELRAGSYKIPTKMSTWELVEYLKNKRQRPDATTIRIIEGMRFKDMRKIINENPDLQHDTADWSDEKLLAEIDPDAPSQYPEGLFFPDSYETDQGSSDLQVYRAAYKIMQQHLNEVWENRDKTLPYKNPYELLIMASIVEKETGHPDDRRNVASVFRNRLEIGMRLQTDPTVIYGMGDMYNGNIRRKDLETDTPYNTYTRAGLTPTPIALPSRAALEAAAHPHESKYLYFVAKLDGTNRSYFSTSLEEHNNAVRKYILKK
ncbi:endolytic transglycosylase MltG [Alysiella crassa]|uniref:Endolytic murein transglycosylase n=1 Tax=Alysiella crassa TaxID=153491 RepID=A0A376BVX3_9NEIS|nr:endolytic transglycosylase MltG [Alysiella crassa]UOP06459.1 endolytic transglycosylase MltG [Alysiella crassa]SSY80991.1 putative aminodeoxychorismate lyase [Alysiella crassa]